MKAAVMLSLPDEVRERLDALAEHYGVPADHLAQLYVVNAVNGVYQDCLLGLKKALKEVEP